MQKTLKARLLVVSIQGEREIVPKLIREESVNLMIESDAPPGTNEFPGVKFIRSHGTKIKGAGLLAPHVVSELNSERLKIGPESVICVGSLDKSGIHHGAAILVTENGRRTARVWKVFPKGNQIYEEVRKLLF